MTLLRVVIRLNNSETTSELNDARPGRHAARRAGRSLAILACLLLHPAAIDPINNCVPAAWPTT